MNSMRIAIVASAVLLVAACTKPVPADTTTAAPPATEADATASKEAPAEATAAVTLYNAYTSSGLTPEGIAGEPGKSFKTSDKIYVGAVLHGQAASSEIKVEWTAEGATAPSSDSATIAVTGASVATVEVTKAAPLAAGKYKVLVYLDGAPAWELAFDVAQ